MSTIKQAQDELEGAARALGMDEPPTWLLRAPDDDDNRVRENLIHRAVKAGLTVESEISFEDAADYSGIDQATLKLLAKAGTLELNGDTGTEIVYGDLIEMMASRWHAKRQP